MVTIREIAHVWTSRKILNQCLFQGKSRNIFGWVPIFNGTECTYKWFKPGQFFIMTYDGWLLDGLGVSVILLAAGLQRIAQWYRLLKLFWKPLFKNQFGRRIKGVCKINYWPYTNLKYLKMSDCWTNPGFPFLNR